MYIYTLVPHKQKIFSFYNLIIQWLCKKHDLYICIPIPFLVTINE